MNMKTEAISVLETEAEQVQKARKSFLGRPCGRVILEALAEAAMGGDIKACDLLMELAGEDVKSRELEWKHQETDAAQAVPVIEDVRPQ